MIVLPNIGVVKGFFEKYIQNRKSAWEINAPQDITAQKCKDYPKLILTGQCLQDTQSIPAESHLTDWLFLHFKLNNSLQEDYKKSGIKGMIFYTHLNFYIRYAMSYICHTISQNDVKEIEDAIGHIKIRNNSPSEIDYFNKLAATLLAYKENPRYTGEYGFETTFHLVNFTVYGKEEETFDNFKDSFKKHSFPYLTMLETLSQIPSKQDEHKEIPVSNVSTSPSTSSTRLLHTSLRLDSTTLTSSSDSSSPTTENNPPQKTLQWIKPKKTRKQKKLAQKASIIRDENPYMPLNTENENSNKTVKLKQG